MMTMLASGHFDPLQSMLLALVIVAHSILFSLLFAVLPKQLLHDLVLCPLAPCVFAMTPTMCVLTMHAIDVIYEVTVVKRLEIVPRAIHQATSAVRCSPMTKQVSVILEKLSL